MCIENAEVVMSSELFGNMTFKYFKMDLKIWHAKYYTSKVI
jgi:hypothetical protein